MEERKEWPKHITIQNVSHYLDFSLKISSSFFHIQIYIHYTMTNHFRNNFIYTYHSYIR